MDTAGRIVFVLAIVLMVASIYAIVTIGIPALSEIETVAASSANRPAPAATAPGSGSPANPTITPVTGSTPIPASTPSGAAAGGEAVLFQNGEALARQIAAPGPDINPADFDAMVNGVTNTLSSNSFSGSYTFAIDGIEDPANQTNRISIITGNGDFFVVANALSTIGATFNMNGEATNLQTGGRQPFGFEARLIPDQLYVGLPANGQTTWLALPLGQIMGDANNLPVDLVLGMMGDGAAAQGEALFNDLPPGVVNLVQRTLGNFPFSNYSSTRILGTQDVEGVTTRQYRIELDADGLINDPTMQNLLRGISGNDNVAVDPQTFSDIPLTLDVYVGIGDALMRRAVIQLGFVSPASTAPDGTQAPETRIDLTLDLTMRGFNESYSLVAPAGAIPMDPNMLGAAQP